MKVTSAEFLKSAFQEIDWPRDRKPEIAFLGRSNVGKSSFINSLLGVRGLARTSSTPGRTQSVNFFLINRTFRFVDLPGYGYARAPRDVKAKWSAAATDYLAKRDQLVLSIHIVDSRHEPTKQDLQLHEWLEHHQKPHIIVATKSDKLSNNELRRNIDRAKRAFKNKQVVVYSAVSGHGRDDAWAAIQSAINTRTTRGLES
jgi:GTP-binding protein